MLRPLSVVALFCAAAAHNPHDIISGLLTSEDGEFVMTISRGLLFRSGDGGDNWMLSHHGLPNPLGQHAPVSFAYEPIPTASESRGVVFLLNTDGSLFKSTDVGRNWVEMPALDKPEVTAISHHHGETLATRIAISTTYEQDGIVLIAAKHLLRSDDGGQTFEALDGTKAPAGGFWRSLLCTNNGMYATNSAGELHRSIDNGKKWSKIYTHGDVDITSMVTGSIYSGMSVVLASKSGVVNVTVSEDGSTKAVTLVTEKKLAAKDGFIGEVLAAVLPSGGVLASSNYVLLRSGKDDETYSAVGGDNGLHTAIMQSDAEGVPSFMRFAVAAKVHRVFIGGYTGVYRSDNGGQTWIKLDTIAPFITHLVVAPGRGGADFSVAACTYTAGCFQGGVSVKDGKAKMTNAKGDDSLAGASMTRILMPAKPSRKTKITQRYLGMSYSPTFGADGIVLAHSNVAGLQRSEDGGKTWEYVQLPVQDSKVDETVHSISFSPSFNTDKTIYVSGFNIGVAKSTDNGKTFSSLKLKVKGTEQRFTVFGTYCKLALASAFKNDGSPGKQTLVVHYRSDEDQGVNKGATRAWMVGYNTTAHLSLSKDGGETFSAIGDTAGWRDVTLVSEQDGTTTAWALCGTASSDRMDHELKYLKEGAKSFVKAELGSVGGKPFGPNGFARALHGDHVVLSFLNGGTLSGTADSASGSITTPLVVSPMVAEPGEFPWFVQTLLPQDDSLRGMGRLVAHSPKFAQDAVIFGAHGFEIMISTDKGSTWAPLTRIDHTVPDNGQFLKHCLKAKNSDTPVLGHEPNSAKEVYNDDGAYCLECEAGYTRNAATGSCGSKKLASGDGEADSDTTSSAGSTTKEEDSTTSSVAGEALADDDLFGDHDYVPFLEKETASDADAVHSDSAAASASAKSTDSAAAESAVSLVSRGEAYDGGSPATSSSTYNGIAMVAVIGVLSIGTIFFVSRRRSRQLARQNSSPHIQYETAAAPGYQQQAYESVGQKA